MQDRDRDRWPGLSLALFVTLASTLAAIAAAPEGVRARVASTRTRPATAAVGRTLYRVTGPYSYRNLTVFLLLADAQDNRDFLTLPEGLKAGLVKVTERQQASIGELQISNLSDRPLFLQEGDRLQGGKQDRTTYASLVIPPRSRNVSLPAFCIEPGRWQESSGYLLFSAAKSPSLAPLAVRRAAKVEKDQGAVWDRVRETRLAARTAARPVAMASASAPIAGRRPARPIPAASMGSNSGGSLNEVLDSPQIRRLADGCLRALGRVVDRQPRAVGVAIVLNSHIEEVNLYPSHTLLRKLYPRILQSYAVDMNIPSPRPVTQSRVSTADVAAFIKTGRARSRREEGIDPHNRLTIQHLDQRDETISFYDGLPVHRQFLARDKAHRPAPTARRRIQPAQQRPVGPRRTTESSPE